MSTLPPPENLLGANLDIHHDCSRLVESLSSESETMMAFSGECRTGRFVTLFDAKYAPVLRELSWTNDLRVCVRRNDKRLRAALAGVGREMPCLEDEVPSVKIPLSEFVVRVLMDVDVPEGCCVVPINFIRHDVREANLAIASGTAKNYKPTDFEWPSDVPPADLDDMKYVPRGIKLSKAGKGKYKVEVEGDDDVAKSQVVPAGDLRGKVAALVKGRETFARTTAALPRVQCILDEGNFDLAHALYCDSIDVYKRTLAVFDEDGALEYHCNDGVLKAPVGKPASQEEEKKKKTKEKEDEEEDAASSYSKDEQGYLDRNAAAHLDWVRMHPENAVKWKQWRTTSADADPERKIQTVATSAARRGIEFDDATARQMTAKLSRSCFYCGFRPEPGEPLNGLDRFKSDGSYTDANTEPCCRTCIAMKGPSDVDVFVHNARSIFSISTSSEQLNVQPGGNTDDKSGFAPLFKVMKKEGRLTVDQKRELWCSPCYLCGRSPSVGIGRLDADGDYYTLRNSRPCCTSCNYMKMDLSPTDFVKHVGCVVARTLQWRIIEEDVLARPLRSLGGFLREPVAAVEPEDGRVLFIFPSKDSAATITGLNRRTLQNKIDNNIIHRGVRWTRASYSEYQRWVASKDDALAAMMRVVVKKTGSPR